MGVNLLPEHSEGIAAGSVRESATGSEDSVLKKGV